MTKRDIFAEINEGFDALKNEREGKLTLRSQKIARQSAVSVSAAEIVALREKLKFSRGVFAVRLRINERTLEGWEQGRAKPNTQASLLLRMVQKFPDTFERLGTL